VTEDDELRASFDAACSLLPAPKRHLVSDLHSYRALRSGEWTLCDASGNVLWKTQAAEHPKPARPPSIDTTRSTGKAGVIPLSHMSATAGMPPQVAETLRDLEKQGIRGESKVSVAALLLGLHEVFDALTRERKARQELEQRVEGLQKALDRATKGALHFQGD